jgi:hypothetical protein
MIQRGEDFGLALKAREPIVIRREGRRHDLDGHLTLLVSGPEPAGSLVTTRQD